MEERGVLAGLTVVNLSNNLIGAHVAQVFADFGAEVIWVEPPGGSPLRLQAAWPFWARGAKSVVLDLHDGEDNASARALAARADVLVETSRPGVMDKLGLGYDDLASVNPRLVYTSVTGFGRTGPLAQLKAYEGIVMAKLGAYSQFSSMVERGGPAFASVPYGSATAAMVALQGTLVALFERERSGAGQRVDTTLVQAFNAHDVFFWIMAKAMEQMMANMAAAPAPPPAPAAPAAPAAAPARPSGMASFALLAGLTADGRWLQFSQSTPKQSAAFVHAVGLDEEFAATMASGDAERIAGFTRRMHEEVHARTLAEWERLFDEHPDVFAEQYRTGTQLLHHPQLVHDDRVVDTDDPARGRVRQPGPLVVLEDTPGRADQPPPAPDQHRAEVLVAGEDPAAGDAGSPPVGRPPLAGVTVLELATFYAAPYGATMLADLGARVIKVEQPDGDPLRWLLPFPEVGGVKALSGKESVAVDMHTDEGREIVYELARRSDLVLQSFRAGVADRLGVDSASLRAVNPDLAYHDGPGFGVGGPYGHRPAYAPTIGAGSGMARRNTGPDIPERPDLTIDEIIQVSGRLGTGNAAVGQADGFGAVAVGAALALALLARELRGKGQRSETSMLSTMAHVLSEDMIEYEGRAPAPAPDHELYGIGALYRLYEAGEGWVFLAVTTDSERAALAAELGLPDELGGVDEAVVVELSARFKALPASEWERRLTAVDVACVEVVQKTVVSTIMDDGGLGRELGYVTDVVHPTLGAHTRATALIEMSRSATISDGTAPLVGAHTDEVLREIGYDDERLADLRGRGIIAG